MSKLPPNAPPPKPPAVKMYVDDELPVVESLGLVRVPKGWVAVLLHSQGDRVVDREIIGEPESRAYAVERLKIEIVRRFILPSGRKS